MSDKFFDQRGLLGPHGENDIIYTSEYFILLLLKYNNSPLMKLNLEPELLRAVESLRKELRGFQSDDPNEPWSHDNHTALISVSQIFGLDYHKTFFWKDWYRRIHPRDLIYYIHSLGGIWRYLMLPLIPLLSLIMMFGVLPSYKNIDGQLILATDGILLTWMRLQTGNYPLTNRIINDMIRYRYGSWKQIFNVYFKELDHPNRVLANKIY